jgi:nitrogen fixation NifU-like protein
MTISQLYSKKVLEHVKKPHNLGEIKNPDGAATVGNPVCGDVMRLYLKIEKKDGQEYIKNIKFQTLGCGAAIATSSMITTLVKGKTLKEAEKISNQAVVEALGGLPPVKMHCSVLAAEALQKAIANYHQNKKK